MLKTRRAKFLAGLLVMGAVIAVPTIAGAQDGPTFDPAGALPQTPDGFSLNLLFIIIGAVLVIFMQAGFALVETGFCRAKHAAHVVSTNLVIFGLGFVGFFLIGFPMMFGGYSYPGYFGLDAALGCATDRKRQLGVPVEGTRSPSTNIPAEALARRRRLLPVHGRLHGHHGHHPDRLDGRALEVEGLRRLGPVRRRHLLPAVRRLDLGWRLAVAARQQPRARLRLRRLRRVGRGARHRRCRGARRGDRARPPHRQVRARTASPVRCPATTSRWPCSARSSCCSAGSASTPHRPSPPPTCASPLLRSTPASPARSAWSTCMFYCMRRLGKPDPAMMANGLLGRPGGHHRAVCVRRRPGRRRSSASSPACSWSRRCSSSRSAAWTTRSARSPCTASAARSACCASDIFSSGDYGAGWNLTDRGRSGRRQRRHRHLRRRLQPRLQAARCPGHRRGRHLDRDVRHRLRLLQDPERPDQGRHPRLGRGRAQRHGHPRDGAPGLPADASFSLDDIVIESLPKAQQEEMAASKSGA